jgi:hypothetical protein
MSYIFAFILALLTADGKSDPSTEICSSTIFGQPGDKWAGGNALYLRRPVNRHDEGIAHRTLPIGSRVLVRNIRTGKASTATVIDRGPYGAIHRGKWVLKKRAHHKGRWRGCADLTPRTARLIEHNGREQVAVTPLAAGDK